MTTAQLTYRKPINYWVYVLLIVAGLLLATVITCPHAVHKHGSEALTIRDCLDKNGIYQVWKSTQFDNQYFLICELSAGQYGLQIVREEGGLLNEVTAFVKGDGSWGKLVNYLSRIATKFNGGLPAQ
jgi:hypothetical protein